MKHREVHPVDVPGCFGCHVASVQMNTGQSNGVEQREKDLRKDLDAYKRLRQDGLHPKGIDGSHKLEAHVESQFDIDLGRIIPKEEKSRVEEGFAIAHDMGFTP